MLIGTPNKKPQPSPCWKNYWKGILNCSAGHKDFESASAANSFCRKLFFNKIIFNYIWHDIIASYIIPFAFFSTPVSIRGWGLLIAVPNYTIVLRRDGIAVWGLIPLPVGVCQRLSIGPFPNALALLVCQSDPDGPRQVLHSFVDQLLNKLLLCFRWDHNQMTTTLLSIPLCQSTL